jgi:hypothetical protein
MVLIWEKPQSHWLIHTETHQRADSRPHSRGAVDPPAPNWMIWAISVHDRSTTNPL